MLNFKNEIIQELIRIILNIIYEPVFQKLNCNHGFRPKKNSKTAIQNLQIKNKKLKYALKINIQQMCDCISYNKLTQILKKKIGDNIFLKLIFNNIKQSSNLNVKKNIFSPILLNIYMHDFDSRLFKSVVLSKFFYFYIF